MGLRSGLGASWGHEGDSPATRHFAILVELVVVVSAVIATHRLSFTCRVFAVAVVYHTLPSLSSPLSLYPSSSLPPSSLYPLSSSQPPLRSLWFVWRWRSRLWVLCGFRGR